MENSKYNLGTARCTEVTSSCHCPAKPIWGLKAQLSGAPSKEATKAMKDGTNTHDLIEKAMKGEHIDYEEVKRLGLDFLVTPVQDWGLNDLSRRSTVVTKKQFGSVKIETGGHGYKVRHLPDDRVKIMSGKTGNDSMLIVTGAPNLEYSYDTCILETVNPDMLSPKTRLDIYERRLNMPLMYNGYRREISGKFDSATSNGRLVICDYKTSATSPPKEGLNMNAMAYYLQQPIYQKLIQTGNIDGSVEEVLGDYDFSLTPWIIIYWIVKLKKGPKFIPETFQVHPGMITYVKTILTDHIKDCVAFIKHGKIPFPRTGMHCRMCDHFVECNNKFNFAPRVKTFFDFLIDINKD